MVKIVYNDFPMPTVPLPEPSPTSLVTETSAGEATQLPNSAPSPPLSEGGVVHVRASSPVDASSAVSPAVVADSQASTIATPPGTLHPQLLSLYSTIQSTLKGSFSAAPPYTIQRLAELILYPTTHYRTLPSYLRALDRVISVSSTADTFPLHVSAADNEPNSFLASSSTSSQANDFNGAALTRIPWLRGNDHAITVERPLASDLRTESTSVIDGPNGAGSMETVTVSVNGIGGAARGTNAFRVNPNAAPAEPLEQLLVTERAKESGLVPRQEAEADEERVHARGPEEIGMEDMGPQTSAATATHVFDAEAAVGRPGEGERVLTVEEKENDEGVDVDVIAKDADVRESEEDGERERERGAR